MHLTQKIMLIIIAVGVSSFGIAYAQEPNNDKWPADDQWVIHTESVLDTRYATASVFTSDGLSFGFACTSRRPLGATIVGPSMDYINMDTQATVVWQVDSNNAATEKWENLTTNRQSKSFTVVSTSAENLASQVMQGKEKLTLRVHGITSSITLENASQYVSQVMQVCGKRSFHDVVDYFTSQRSLSPPNSSRRR